jgi:hypothetical protein
LRNAEGQPFRAQLRTYSTWPELPSIAVALQAQLREIGVEIEVVVGNASDIPLMHRDGTLQLGLMSRNYALVPDPLGAVMADFAPEGSDWGAMNWSNAELTASVTRMDGTENPEMRTALRRRVSAILQAELPVIPVTMVGAWRCRQPPRRQCHRGTPLRRATGCTRLAGGGADVQEEGMRLLRPLLARLAQAALIAVLVGVVGFALMHALPGDQAFRLAAERYGRIWWMRPPPWRSARSWVWTARFRRSCWTGSAACCGSTSAVPSSPAIR